MSDDFNIEKSIMEYEDEYSYDGHLKPNTYIHFAIISSQKVLLASSLKGSFNDGVLSYAILIEQIENMCKAAGYIDEENYNKLIGEFKSSEDYLNNDKLISIAKLANKKLYLLMKEVFSKSTIHSPLKLK